MLRGYELALRPKLLIGRFRSVDSGINKMLASVRKALADSPIRWSVTGGPAANALQKFYRGLQLPIFVDFFLDLDLDEFAELERRLLADGWERSANREHRLAKPAKNESGLDSGRTQASKSETNYVARQLTHHEPGRIRPRLRQRAAG